MARAAHRRASGPPDAPTTAPASPERELADAWAHQLHRYFSMQPELDDEEADRLARAVLEAALRLTLPRPPGAAAPSWRVYRLARQHLLQHRARRSLRPASSHGLGPDPAGGAAPTADLSPARLKQALACLSDPQRQVVVLRLVQRQGTLETALALELTEAEVRCLQASGLRALQRALDQASARSAQ